MLKSLQFTFNKFHRIKVLAGKKPFFQSLIWKQLLCCYGFRIQVPKCEFGFFWWFFSDTVWISQFLTVAFEKDRDGLHFEIVIWYKFGKNLIHPKKLPKIQISSIFFSIYALCLYPQDRGCYFSSGNYPSNSAQKNKLYEN